MTGPNIAGKAVGFAKRRVMMAAVPILLVGALIVGVGFMFLGIMASQSGGPQAQAEMSTAKQASSYGLSMDEIRTLRSVAADANIPWQVMVSLVVAESGKQAGQTSAAPAPASTATGSSPAQINASTAQSTSTTPSTQTTAISTTTASSALAVTGWGRFALTEKSGLTKQQAEDLPTAAAFVAKTLQSSLQGQPGFSGAGSLLDGAKLLADGMHIDTGTDNYKAREKSFIAALVKLPVDNNNQPFMTQVYETAQAWALGQSTDCSGTGANLASIPGGGLSTAVPEPMRSEIIRAAQAANVAPGAVAGLYLTEQNGFQFMYRYYDGGKDLSAFHLTPTAAEWHLSTYGSAGEWPAGGTFRGPFQFGPIWESTYKTAAHPDVLKFADAAFGAAKYMADLGATGTNPESIRKAAESYNGQTSWDIGGGIRNPDPGKYKVVRELYADQVVYLASALSQGAGAGAATAGTSTSSNATSGRSTSTAPISGNVPGSAVASATVAVQNASGPSQCGVAGALAGSATGPGGVTVLVKGVNVTIPANADVAPELTGKTVVAPNAQVAAGIAWGLTQLGTPYVYGGGGLGSTNPGGPDHGCPRASCLSEIGYDCSGLSWTVFDHMSPSMQLSVGTSGDMAAGGTHIPLSQAVAGDLITYGASAGGTHHVAVSLGWIDGKLAILEAPETGKNVRVKFTSSSDINSWASRYWTGA